MASKCGEDVLERKNGIVDNTLSIIKMYKTHDVKSHNEDYTDETALFL